MLRKVTLLFSLLLAFVAKAQFEVESDTLYAYGFAPENSSEFVDLNAEVHIKSLSISGERILWVRSIESLPDTTWTSAVCDIISCRGPEVDTGSFYFGPMDSGIMSFHFYPTVFAGKGQMTVKFYRESNPLDFVEIVTFVHAWKPVSVKTQTVSINNIYPNPVLNSLSIVSSEIENGQVKIFNSMGQLVFTQAYESNVAIDLASLASGVYTVELSNENLIATSKFIKQ